jgi:hypothetical protein
LMRQLDQQLQVFKMSMFHFKIQVQRHCKKLQ